MEQMTGYALLGIGNAESPEMMHARVQEAFAMAEKMLQNSIGTVEYKGKTMDEWTQSLKKIQWNKTSEILPEINQAVLCYFPQKSYGPQIMVAYKATGGGASNWFSESFRWGIVTHWMPLPEPPKEEPPIGGNSDDFVHGNHG